MSFQELLNTFLLSQNIGFANETELEEGKIRADVAILNLNRWLAENKELIAQLPNPIRNDQQTKINISVLTRQFPVIWSEKELVNHVFPLFSKEDYIEYLSRISNSYKNLPVPNYNPPFTLYNLQNYPRQWWMITNENLISTILDKQVNGKDYFGLSFDHLQKLICNCPQVVPFIVTAYNDIFAGGYNLSAEWCSANICSRFKGGDRTDPKRFRPLMILPLLVRIMDGIISGKLHDIILQYNVIDTRVQKAVLKNSSGLWENVFDVNMRLSKLNQEEDDKLFFFIDLNNAFGSVNYRTMLTILQRHNFSPELSAYFERYYKNVFGIYRNTEFKWKNGLFQGSALSNIFFLIYIDFAMKNLFKDLKAMRIVNPAYDLQDNSFAFVDDIVMILPQNDKLSKTMGFMNKIFGFYGLTINSEKTYFVVKDPSIETLEFNGITYRKATREFAYLGHCLFIYENEVMKNILERVENCLTTIDSFNIPGKLKAYIYYTCIFLRINRTLECFYLIKGKTQLMEEIIETITYFVYRWGVSDYFDYGRKHLEYIYSKGSAKLLKSPNLQAYHQLVEGDEEIEKYGTGNDIDSKNQDFTHIMEFESPDHQTVEENLTNMKSNNYFPIEHYEKVGSGFYADNFIAWTE